MNDTDTDPEAKIHPPWVPANNFSVARLLIIVGSVVVWQRVEFSDDPVFKIEVFIPENPKSN